jgi:Spx/MgsR family transcriptional regulator
MITLYGIPNCDSVKKAMTKLKEDDVEYTFHNYKTMGITEAKLKLWCKQVGWEMLLNTRGTTWRKMAAEHDLKTLTETDAIQIMVAHPSCIKRPIVEEGSGIKVGL